MDKVTRYIPTEDFGKHRLQDKLLLPYKAGFIVAKALIPDGINTKVIVEKSGITMEFTGKNTQDLEHIVDQFFQGEYSP